ncbi:MAG: hypothetical protein ACLFQM_11805 [Fidelibacterota bacterium]
MRLRRGGLPVQRIQFGKERKTGGKGNKENRYRELEYRVVISLGLESRIIND